jgi:hypothetical protein
MSQSGCSEKVSFDQWHRLTIIYFAIYNLPILAHADAGKSLSKHFFSNRAIEIFTA